MSKLPNLMFAAGLAQNREQAQALLRQQEKLTRKAAKKKDIEAKG